jgi:hypothetical protein
LTSVIFMLARLRAARDEGRGMRGEGLVAEGDCLVIEGDCSRAATPGGVGCRVWAYPPLTKPPKRQNPGR